MVPSFQVPHAHHVPLSLSWNSEQLLSKENQPSILHWALQNAKLILAGCHFTIPSLATSGHRLTGDSSVCVLSVGLLSGTDSISLRNSQHSGGKWSWDRVYLTGLGLFLRHKFLQNELHVAPQCLAHSWYLKHVFQWKPYIQIESYHVNGRRKAGFVFFLMGCGSPKLEACKILSLQDWDVVHVKSSSRRV